MSITIKKITENDLEILSYSVSIPKLTTKIVDESFAYCLEIDLNSEGFSTKWVALDDMGYISVNFSNLTITPEQQLAVVKCVNEILNN
ncbi:hypothetical protein SAMN05660493_01522 [Epilithonimonas bovis DSM 19482]|uniref:Uncharacterized protein n=1 Tax=Epilithonimonas bovis DSM 19482 TaxID=1121284 RepID=A0A1U7PVU6_9FLAO|nr:hypothetical protein [Epilithonimonas bovis]SIT96827.1 hypothetical protein SAMN05660493_01522 [Epilithonimonas bovis DSM 19482]